MAMAEIMRRRFRRWAQAKAQGADLVALRRSGDSALHTGGLNDWPDLVMIDGGKGQLSAVMEALRELRLDDELFVCSLAKQREEVFLPGAKQPLVSEAEQLGVQVLRRLRDEAHRFAVSFHRQQRGERMKRSRLSDIPGLGPKRVKELLAHFRSIDAIQLASQQTLAAAPGVGAVLASQIWEYFHPQEAQQPSDLDQIPDDQFFEDQIFEGQIPDHQIFEDQISDQLFEGAEIPVLSKNAANCSAPNPSGAQLPTEIEAAAPEQANSNPEQLLELAC